MMTLGKNVKITAPASARPAARALFETLGATLITPESNFDVFASGGSNVGFHYVGETETLTTEQMRIAPWLELVVDDVGAARARIEALGLSRIEYHDKEHAYYAGPGGFVFRLASS